MLIHTDVIILGSGIAALQTARKLSERFEVHVITKGELTSSSSYIAQGGVAAALSKEDYAQLHIEDTLMAGENHHHLPNVQLLVAHGAQAMKTLLAEGIQVDRKADGSLSFGLEGAHRRHRIVHAGGDSTGRSIITHLLATLPSNVTVHTGEFAYELILNHNGECCGVYVLTENGVKTYVASYVIIATGGAGALYETTSNWESNIGDGIAMAYLAGAAVADMEFMQFHPSLLYVDGNGLGLVSEAVRGAGATFVNEDGEPFMQKRHPLGDLAPRHVTAFEIYKERANGKEVYLDISRVEKFTERFPTITANCLKNGIGLAKGKIPVAPGSHFLMGGIVASSNGQTSIPRLFAIGEAACTGVHGANRLASNSLLEGLAFGDLAATYLLQYGVIQTDFTIQKQIQNLIETPFSKEELRKKMMKYVGIIRDRESLQSFLATLPSLQTKARLKDLSKEQIELIFMHINATLMTTAALARTESRGAHIRLDYPQAQDEWSKQWILLQQGKWNVRSSLYEYNKTKKHADAIF